jgi:hypothetical protein
MKSQATHVIAGAAIASPLWTELLLKTSYYAGVFMPIFGAIWLLTQIVRAWRKTVTSWWSKRND